MIAVAFVAVGCIFVACGCREDSRRGDQPTESPPELRATLPDSVLVDDPAVNEVIRQAVSACIEGEYEPFRALWSARQEPVSREQFERGWKSAQRISVLDIQPMRHAEDGGVLYYVHARVELSPSVAQPEREVVLLVARENGAWRLARAPKKLVQRVLGLPPDGAEERREEPPPGE